MITEQELKSQCTPEFIKWMCELAEGFELCKDDTGIQIDDIWISLKHIKSWTCLPLLIHRAVEEWNRKQNKNCGNYFISINCENVFTESGKDVYSLSGVEETLYHPIKDYMYSNYQTQSLTQCECACLHCLLDIFKEERK